MMPLDLVNHIKSNTQQLESHIYAQQLTRLNTASVHIAHGHRFGVNTDVRTKSYAVSD